MTGSRYGRKAVFVGPLAVFSVWAGVHCSSDTHGGFTNNDASTGGGSGSGSGGAGGSGSATSGSAAGSGSGGSGTASTSSGGGSGGGSSSGTSGAGDGGTTTVTDGGDDGSSAPPDAGVAVIDGSVRACTPMKNPNATRPIECDFLQQSIDFEDYFSFPSPPGSIKVTNFGSALGAYAINNCGPYCYAKNFTINVDIVGGGTQAQEQGEVIFEFPSTGAGLPIPSAVGRSAYAWILLDGPTKPAFAITGQLVLETSAGIITGPITKALAYHDWLQWQMAEFKFTIAATSFSGPPTNVTGIGFRIVGPANLPTGQEWHGLAYIDHLQVRLGGAANNPTDAGPYPFGLQ
jgi:hypothetical protein